MLGHLLECAGQVTGGYFADPGFKDVADLALLGFPLAEVAADGSGTVTKVEGSGGLVTAGFKVTIDDATRARLLGAAGTNTIQFRFNGTDGNSNGYRILDLQFQDASGKNLSPVTKKWADIETEKTAGKVQNAVGGLKDAVRGK